MSELYQTGNRELALSRETLIPTVQTFGRNEIEFTFLGENGQGEPTWILWNAAEPTLIAILSQAKMGFHLEQRTSAGVTRHENISLTRVQRALER